jgi:hypothetical protein
VLAQLTLGKTLFRMQVFKDPRPALALAYLTSISNQFLNDTTAPDVDWIPRRGQVTALAMPARIWIWRIACLCRHLGFLLLRQRSELSFSNISAINLPSMILQCMRKVSRSFLSTIISISTLVRETLEQHCHRPFITYEAQV